MTIRKSKWTLKRVVVGGAALIAALGLGTAAYGHHRGGGGGFGHFGLHRVLRTLDLTEEQEVLAVRLMRQMREEHEALRGTHQAQVAQLKAQLAVGQPDSAALHQLLDDMAKERTQLAHTAIDRFLEFHATLTSEQRAELVAKIEKVEERRRRWQEE